jgi:hypothetical protein
MPPQVALALSVLVQLTGVATAASHTPTSDDPGAPLIQLELRSSAS